MIDSCYDCEFCEIDHDMGASIPICKNPHGCHPQAKDNRCECDVGEDEYISKLKAAIMRAHQINVESMRDYIYIANKSSDESVKKEFSAMVVGLEEADRNFRTFIVEVDERIFT